MEINFQWKGGGCLARAAGVIRSVFLFFIVSWLSGGTKDSQIN